MKYELKETATFIKWRKGIKDAQARKAIAVRLTRATEGHFGDAEPVGSGVSEMRIFVGKGYRIYFVEQHQTIVLLLCGGIKSSKKQQQDDIKKAKQMLKDLKG